MGRSTEKVVARDMSEVVQNLRYERKFIYQNIEEQDLVEAEVLTNSFCFREIFHRRTVNNIYYDDQGMSFYHQNVAGDELRDKYRLRWYGDDFDNIEKPTLEIKKKMGAVGDKFSFKLPDFTHSLGAHTVQEAETAILKEVTAVTTPELALKLGQLSPSLFNSYERRYFLSACDKYRITIDYNMNFYNPNFSNYKESKVSLTDIVLELKYKVEDDKDARALTQELSARLSKNSKYVRGVNVINHHKET